MHELRINVTGYGFLFNLTSVLLYCKFFCFSKFYCKAVDQIFVSE
uniref:Uncharacterized protein n=1 Tax=Arundo donax TaxID=35708 RepID=A0A0A9H5S0_ARUDO